MTTSRRGFFKTSNLLSLLCLTVLCFTLSSCGSVDWFPAFKRLSTTPDAFSFPTKTNVAIFSTITSASITVSGLTGDSSPISINGPVGSNSQYAINKGTATSAAGTVKNGDTVVVSHTSSSSPGNSVVSTLSIGNVNGTFTSTTQLVETLTFAPQTVAANTPVTVNATLVAFDGLANTHVISIKDSLSSSNAFYALDNSANLTNITQTIPNLNSRTIFIKNTAPATPGTSVTTTLTIDGVESKFIITAQ